MIDENSETWLSKLQSDDCDAADYEAFRRWYHADEAHRRAFDKARHLQAQLNAVATTPAIVALRERALRATADSAANTADQDAAEPAQFEHQTLSEQLTRVVRHLAALLENGVGRFTVVAASAALAVALAVLWPTPTKVETQFWSTSIGEQKTIALEDGSEVILDTNTQIEVVFSRNARSVELRRGQGFFDVAEDPARPFIVNTNNGRVTVLGTAFTVAQSATALVVTVKEGSVEVMPLSEQAAAQGVADRVVETLSPGEQLSYSPTKGVKRRTLAQVDTEFQWVAGNLVFNEDNLEDVVSEISRYTQHDIVLQSHELKKIKVNAVFRVGELETFMKALKFTLGIDIIRKPNGDYELRPRPR